MGLGIASLFVVPLITAPVAWLLARHDLKEMAAGRMDLAGREQTRIGRLCALVSIAVWPLLLTCCCGITGGLQLWRGSRYVSALGSRRITEAEFNRVQAGMTEKQILELLGKPAKTANEPTRFGTTTPTWYWYEKGGPKTFLVEFTEEGRVQTWGSNSPD